MRNPASSHGCVLEAGQREGVGCRQRTLSKRNAGHIFGRKLYTVSRQAITVAAQKCAWRFAPKCKMFGHVSRVGIATIAAVAQLAARRSHNPKVGSSILSCRIVMPSTFRSEACPAAPLGWHAGASLPKRAQPGAELPGNWRAFVAVASCSGSLSWVPSCEAFR